MKQTMLFVIAVGMIAIYFSACNSTPAKTAAFSTDSTAIASGEKIFNQYCSGCHNFRQDGIGPQLRAVTGKASPEWLHHFIQNPQQMISSGDERAKNLYKKFSSVMPSFSSLKEDEIDNILAYLNTYAGKTKKEVEKDKDEVDNPYADTIPLSDLVVDVAPVTQMPASNDGASKPWARITKLGPLPGSEDLIVLEMRGRLYRLHNKELSVYFDLAALRPKFIERPGYGAGFGSYAFHPDFTTNGLLYTTHTEMPGPNKAEFSFPDTIRKGVQWVITEWKTKDPKAPVFSGTSRELFRVDFVSGIHGVQEITFNPLSRKGSSDYGLLYIGVGDGGATENGYPGLSHDKNKIWGSVLRIDPAGNNSSNGKYGIPAGNPFLNGSGMKEIYAYGFRNPHRITWTLSGKMLVYNIGQGHIESINMVSPGQDFGWPIREGAFSLRHLDNLTRIYPLSADDSSYHITYPVAAFDHDEGIAISGGFEYQGSSIPELKGKTLFGDINKGRLFYVNTADMQSGKLAPIKEWRIAVDNSITSLPDLCKNQRVELRFGIDAKKELYIFTKTDGRIYKLVKGSHRSNLLTRK